MSFDLYKLNINAVVKGYHVYKVKLEPGTACELNQYIQEILEVRHDGELVGHVPATPNLNTAFIKVMDRYPGYQIHW